MTSSILRMQGGKGDEPNMWIDAYRERMGLSLEELARTVNKYRQFTKQTIFGYVSAKLIYLLEVDDKTVTQPVLADAIAAVCGATREQRNSILAKHNWSNTWACPDDSEMETIIRKAIYFATGRMPEVQKHDEHIAQKWAASFNKRGVVKLDRMGNTIESYDSVLAAANLNSLSTKWVRNRCRRAIKDRQIMFAKGFTFRYADDWDSMSQAERLADINAR